MDRTQFEYQFRVVIYTSSRKGIRKGIVLFADGVYFV